MTATSTRARRAFTAGVLVLAATALTGCSLLGSIADSTPAGEVDAFAIKVGDCLNDAQINDEITSVPFIECSEPHDSEVFARTDVAGDAFPGNASLETQLADFCRGDVFTQFIGIPYEDSVYDTSGYYPSESSWQSSDRELLCTVWDDSGQVTGTLAGING